MKVNYHTHTQRCRHAQGYEEEYVMSAVCSGINILGFSDHAPFPDKDYGLRMSYEELEVYLSAIDRLKRSYSNKISLLKGLEIEYMPEYMQYYDDLINKKGLDYLMLGQHFFTSSGTFMNLYSDINSTGDYILYADSVAQALSTGYFKMVAHPDIIFINSFAWDKNCETACDIIIDAAEESHTVLEFNANGFRREKRPYPDGMRYQYPYMKFWEKVAKANVSVVVGSDCHNPSQIWDFALTKAYNELNKIGIKASLYL